MPYLTACDATRPKCQLTAVLTSRIVCHMLADEPTFLSIPEAAEAFEVSENSVRRWVKSRRLRAIKLPSGHYKIRREDVLAILAGDEQDGAA